MSRRNILRPHTVFDESDSTSNPESKATDVSGLDNVTYLFAVDASVIGEMFIEFSLDDSNPQNWHQLNFGESLVINGSTDTSYLAHIKNHGFKFLRSRFENDAGSGPITGIISGNTVGA